MAEDEDDDWEGREGRWTRGSESSGAGSSDGERYYELPDGEVVQGPPPDDVEAEPVEAPEQDEEEGGLAGLFGGDEDADDADEPDEPEEDEEDEDSSIVPLVAGIVVLLLVLLVLLVAAAYAGIADPLGIGSSLPGAGGGDDGGDGDGNGDGGGNGMNETELFSYPVNWTESSNAITDESGSLDEGQATDVTTTISRRNLTSMSISFQWTDDTDESVGDSGTDTFRVELIAPDGTNTSGTGTNSPGQTGFINLTMDLATTPSSPTAIEAETQANATQDLLAQQPPVETWTGEWTVNITLQEADPCEQQTSPTGDTVNVGTDCSQDWSFDLEYSWYEGLLEEGTRVES